MADLPELIEWTAGIYQLETSDPVLAGPDGIDNLQAKQLANRTRWLKDKTDSQGASLASKASKATTLAGYGITDAFTKPETTSAIQQAIASLVASSPAALDTLKELADALGNDPNFATTMTNALAGKANKAATLGGYGITDAFTKPETTSAIQQAIASLVASSPAALDTLKELADALGNDPNFATTMTNALAGKANKATTLIGYGITDAFTKSEVYDLLSGATTGGIAGAASDLRVWATGTSTSVALTANAICVKNATGQQQVLNAVSLSGDLAISGAGGLDTGVSKPNMGYNIFVIWNSASGAKALLFSLSPTDPSMPPGFTYKALISWAATDQNKLPFTFFQRGSAWRYRPVTGSNLLAMPLLASGSRGDPTTGSWVTAGVGSLVSPVASKINLVMSITLATSAAMIVAPNPSYGGYNSTTNPAPAGLSSSNFLTSPTPVELVLEESVIYWACNASSGRIVVSGFEINL
ncbi:hypothetical protein NJH83_21755 [Pseudomonas chlororaphis]|uniref:hypothetical protein n=1 Tax=Pseudomonas chlororaphis TaxID=587753 RepID=UPI00209B0DCB|nr:hypothetical protein [Pseudomonas chlororaphis]MCO7612859.1 hypothetical protein [Pseudomonas chlororaphis]